MMRRVKLCESPLSRRTPATSRRGCRRARSAIASAGSEMRGVVAQNDQRVLAGADEHDRNRIQHRVPKNEHRAIAAAIETHSPAVAASALAGSSADSSLTVAAGNRSGIDLLVLCGCMTSGFAEMSSTGVSDRRKAMTLLTLAKCAIKPRYARLLQKAVVQTCVHSGHSKRFMVRMRASNQYQTNAWHREFTIETRDPSPVTTRIKRAQGTGNPIAC